MNKYKELKNRHQEELNEIPLIVAFDAQDLEQEMKSLGLQPNETDAVYKLHNCAYILKSDRDRYNGMLQRFKDEEKQAINADKTGDGFIYDMFFYQFEIHQLFESEFVYHALKALELTKKDILKSPNLLNGYKKAFKVFENYYY